MFYLFEKRKLTELRKFGTKERSEKTARKRCLKFISGLIKTTSTKIA